MKRVRNLVYDEALLGKWNLSQLVEREGHNIVTTVKPTLYVDHEEPDATISSNGNAICLYIGLLGTS